MKTTTSALRLAVLGAGLIAGVIVLAMWLMGGSGEPAQANTPITVGFDMNTAGNSCPGDGTNCTLDTIDTCVVPTLVSDGKVNDGCPPDGAETDAECDNAVDDDGDTKVNDGCPLVGNIAENAEVIDGGVDVDGDTGVDTDDDLADLAGYEIIDGLVDINDSGTIDDTDDGTWTETGYDVINGYVDIDDDAAVPPDDGDDGTLDALCDGDADDDGDTKVNDGCPQVGTVAEADAECDNALDDDVADTGAGTTPESSAQCDNDLDDDYDGLVNDGCPAVGVCAGGETDTQCENSTDDDPERCVQFDVFLKDLPELANQPYEGGISSFQYHIGEKDGLTVGTIAGFTHTNTTVNLLVQLPDVSFYEYSEAVGSSVPSWDASAADLGDIEFNPPFTKACSAGWRSTRQGGRTGSTS